MGSWEDLVSVAKKRINTLKKDCVIAVTGNPGRGKTCLAMHLAYAVDKQFTPSTCVLFYPTLDKAKKMFEDLGQQRAIIFDEAMLTMYLRQAMTKNSIQLNQFFSVDARKNFFNVIILVIEDIQFIDKYFRNSRLDFWIECMERTSSDAYAVTFISDSSPAAKDSWRLSDLDKLFRSSRRGHKVAGETREDWKQTFRKFELFFGDFVFEDLAPSVWEEYNTARIKAKAEYEKTTGMHVCGFESVNGRTCSAKATVQQPFGWRCQKHEAIK